MNWLLLALAFLFQVATTPIKINEDTKVTWDPVTLDIAGNPETIASYQVGTVKQGVDPDTASPLLAVPGTEVEAAVGLFLLAQLYPAGTYESRVRAVDVEGNESDWGTPVLTVDWPDRIPPEAPKNFRLLLEVGDVKIQAEGTIEGL